MACETWATLILDRVADELGEDEAVRLEQHLAQCEDCAREERRVRGLLGAAVPRKEWTPDPSMEERLLGEMRKSASRERSPRPSEARTSGRGAAAKTRWAALRDLLRHRVPIYAAAAALVIAVGSGFLLGSATREPATQRPGWTAPSRVTPAERGQEPAADQRESYAALGRGFRTDRAVFATTPADAFSWAGVIVDSL
jgi:hypothetical protein